MVCTHIIGTWKFLRIGAGADKVKAAFCIICPYCLERMATTKDEDDINEDDIDKIRRKARSNSHVML